MEQGSAMPVGNARSNPQERPLSSSSCMGQKTREDRMSPMTTLEDVKVVVAERDC